MSALYNLEPQPTAKVLLQTTSGDILLELFAKQTPLASRNFLQLCLDGYYNGTIFHRLVPGFVVQGGDPTGTGNGGEAIYDGGLFEDEFHSRLKFNRRGLLGMANSGTKNDNGSQFFLTLGKTEELDGRNTMFGRVVGDTIYNLMKMADTEMTDVEGSERPLYPTKVTGAEILVNPFDDMVRREPKVKAKLTNEPEKKKPKKKTGKVLLSFGGDDGDDELVPVIKKAKFNTNLVSGDLSTNHGATSEVKKTAKQTRMPKHESPSSLRTVAEPHTQLPLPKDEEPSRDSTSSPETEQVGKVTSLLERTNAQIAELKASMKRNVPTALTEGSRKKSALEQMIPENSTRGRKRKHGNTDGGKSADAQALKMLNAFRAKLDQAPPESAMIKNESIVPNATSEDVKGDGNVGEDDEEAHLCDLHFIANCQSCRVWDEGEEGKEDANDDDKGWMSHALSFEKDRLGKDLNWKKKNEDELVVIDPREKAKEIAKEIKDGQKAKRAAKGGGNSVWDQDRDRGRLPERMAGERGRT